MKVLSLRYSLDSSKLDTVNSHFDVVFINVLSQNLLLLKTKFSITCT